MPETIEQASIDERKRAALDRYLAQDGEPNWREIARAGSCETLQQAQRWAVEGAWASKKAGIRRDAPKHAEKALAETAEKYLATRERLAGKMITLLESQLDVHQSRSGEMLTLDPHALLSMSRAADIPLARASDLLRLGATATRGEVATSTTTPLKVVDI